MSTGPLRRTIGLAGLLALVPVFWQLAAGTITPEDAAVRAGIVAVVVVVLGRLAQLVLRGLLRRMERRREDDPTGLLETAEIRTVPGQGEHGV